jgi:hypothetical protein
VTKRWCVVLLAVAMAAVAADARAQYFGRNKVQYRTFDFQVLATEHFDIYYYPEERDAAAMVGRLAERWRARLGRFFEHDLRGRQAVILYAAPAHFRQTNAVEACSGKARAASRKRRGAASCCRWAGRSPTRIMCSATNWCTHISST